jgi:hypothetical protein
MNIAWHSAASGTQRIKTLVTAADRLKLRRLASSVSTQMVRSQTSYSDAPPSMANSAPVM